VNLFLREIAANRKSTLIWAVSLSAIAILFTAMYPGFSKDVDALARVLEQFPEAIKAAFNLTADTFLTVEGFYGYILSFAVLAAAIQAMNVGTGAISKEVAGKTADFLLSKPVTRTRVFGAKLLAGFAVIVVTSLVFAAVSYLAISAVAPGEADGGTVLLLASTLFLMQLVFLALGSLFGVVIPKIKSVIAVSLPTVFAFYIIGALGDVLGQDEVRYVSPFRYFDPAYIIQNQSLEAKYLVVGAIVMIVALAVSYLVFIKKDIRSAT